MKKQTQTHNDSKRIRSVTRRSQKVEDSKQQ